MQPQEPPITQSPEQVSTTPQPQPMTAQSPVGGATPSQAPAAGPAALGIVAIVAGILSLLGGMLWYLSIPLGIVAVVAGILAMSKTSAKRKGLAGIVLGALGILIGLVVLATSALPGTSTSTTDDNKETSSSASDPAPAADDSSEGEDNSLYGKITRGMTKAEVEAIVGKPADTCETSGGSETCTYGGVLEEQRNLVVIFTDGVVRMKTGF